MIRTRARMLPALGAVAALFVLIALFMRPHGLPPGSAAYQPAPVNFKALPSRPATAGVTYAIDTIEVMGVQHPIAEGKPFHATGKIVFHGWAVVPATLAPATHLLMSVDGAQPAAVADYGIPRPDVGAAVNPSATNSGFSAVLDVTGIARGQHTVRFSLEDAAGMRIALPTPVTFVLN